MSKAKKVTTALAAIEQRRQGLLEIQNIAYSCADINAN